MISIHALREEGDRPLCTLRATLALFLSTPSARRATVAARCQVVVLVISIHALREEGDLNRLIQLLQLSISIHALREEGDFPAPLGVSTVYLFLSTPSARRATCDDVPDTACFTISIHALREEGDVWWR